MFALSVSISTSSSPTATSSPTCFSQVRIVPSSIESERRGMTSSGIGSGPPSTAEVTCDHHLLNLVRSLADLKHLGVAVEAGDRVLVHVAVAAMDLDRLGGGGDGEAGREQFCHRALARKGAA